MAIKMSTNTASVLRLMRICRNVTDIDKEVAFYREVLNFCVVSTTTHYGDAWGKLMGVTHGHAQSVLMRLGEQELELIAFNPGGASYPIESSSADLWFQHIAIVVSDIGVAFSRLQACSCELISAAGPQKLPPASGSVSACKFRDPDGHPLELIYFPPGTGNVIWQGKSDLFLGIDHSGIDVRNMESSTDFYTHLLDLHIASRTSNSGKQQDKLDHLDDVLVQVVALEPEIHTSPHLELLCYEQPVGKRIPAHRQCNDIDVDRLVFQVNDLVSLIKRLEADHVHIVSDGIITILNGQHGMQIQDPTGHMILLMEGEEV
jgi:catechol 2,3-dioxygenase-like lactoylglutathione lyase family enzyme